MNQQKISLSTEYIVKKMRVWTVEDEEVYIPKYPSRRNHYPRWSPYHMGRVFLTILGQDVADT
jgi:hypothetical protein